MTTSTPGADVATTASRITARRFAALFALGATGVVALFLTTDPGLYAEAAAESGLSPAVIAALAAAQSLVLLTVAVLVGLALAPRLGFRSHVLARVSEGAPPWPALRSELKPTFGVGTAVGGVLLVAERVAPAPLAAGPEPTAALLLETLPMRVLYGGITEELLLRWAVMSLLAFALWKTIGRGSRRPAAGIVWTAIGASAVLFGVGHLPAAATIYGTLSLDVIAFVLAGNGIAGVAFGWLFWRYSLEAAMTAHGFAHLVAVSVGVVALL